MGRMSRGSIDCHSMGKRIGDCVVANMRRGIPSIGTRRELPGGHNARGLHMLDGRALGACTIDAGSGHRSAAVAASIMSVSIPHRQCTTGIDGWLR